MPEQVVNRLVYQLDSGGGGGDEAINGSPAMSIEPSMFRCCRISFG